MASNFTIHQLKDGKFGIRSNFFYSRIANTWNKLPDYVVSAENVNVFKNRLDKYWKQDPLMYNHKVSTGNDNVT